MTDRIRKLRDGFVSSNRCVDVRRAVLLTESYKKHYSKTEVMKKALALENILLNTEIEIRDGELIVGNFTKFRRGVPLFPEYATEWLSTQMDDFMTRPGDRFDITNEQKTIVYKLLEFWKGKSLNDRIMSNIPSELKQKLDSGVIANGNHQMSSPGHIVPHYSYLINNGYNAIIEQCEEKIEELDTANPKYIEMYDFYSACMICSNAIIAFARRYAELAKKLAKKERSQERKIELIKIAENCDVVPGKPAKTYWQALQLIYFVQLAIQLEGNGLAISIGRLDCLIGDFYENDVLGGILDRGSALELMECFFLKLGEVDKIYSNEAVKMLQGPGHGQTITIGGVDACGRDSTNEISYIVLDADMNVRTVQPDIAVRLHFKTPKKLLDTVTRNVKEGLNKVKIFNDNVVTKSMLGIGVPIQEAWDFSFLGCSEPVVSGKTNSWGNCGHVNLSKCVELAMNDGVCMLSGEQLGPKTGDAERFRSIEDLKHAFKAQVEFFVHGIVSFDNMLDKYQKQYRPLPFYSTVIADCLENGIEFNAGGARINTTSPLGVGPITAGDSLVAVKTLVFDKKMITMKELLCALKTNFKGRENVRQMLLNNAPKYGNDIDEADKYSNYVSNVFCDELEKYTNCRGGRFVAGLYYLTSNIPFGEKTAATADGRKANEPLNDGGISPTHGADKCGATAVLKSAGKLSVERVNHGLVLNQKFHPSLFNGRNAEAAFSSYMKSILDVDCWESQYNVVKAETLIDAQENPDKYRGLVIRVAGYSAYFTELEKFVQDDIISRTEHSAI